MTDTMLITHECVIV